MHDAVDRVARQYFVTLIHEPVERRGGVIDGQSCQHRIDGAATDAYQVVVVLLGRVDNALLPL